MRVLLWRLSSLGDVLMTLPLARALSDTGERVTLWTHPRLVPLLDTSPDASVVAAADPGGFDRAFDLQGLGGRGFHAVLRAPILDGVRRLVSMPTRWDRSHTLDRYAQTAGLSPSAVRPASTAQRPLLRVAADRGDGRGLRVGLVVGGRWPAKRVPAPVLALGLSMIAGSSPRTPVVPVALGGDGERGLLDALEPRISMVGEQRDVELGSTDVRAFDADLSALARIVAGCDVVIAGDTGPAHLAQALGVPTLVLFGPTSDRRWGAWAEGSCSIPSVAPCSPCSGHGQRTCRYPVAGVSPCLTPSVEHLHRGVRGLLTRARSRKVGDNQI